MMLTSRIEYLVVYLCTCFWRLPQLYSMGMDVIAWPSEHGHHCCLICIWHTLVSSTSLEIKRRNFVFTLSTRPVCSTNLLQGRTTIFLMCVKELPLGQSHTSLIAEIRTSAGLCYLVAQFSTSPTTIRAYPTVLVVCLSPEHVPYSCPVLG